MTVFTDAEESEKYNRKEGKDENVGVKKHRSFYEF